MARINPSKPLPFVRIGGGRFHDWHLDDGPVIGRGENIDQAALRWQASQERLSA